MLADILADYFEVGCNCYHYILERVKYAELTARDFREYDDGDVAEIAEYLISNGVVIPVLCQNCGWWHRHKQGDLSRGVCDKYAMSKSENGYCDEPLLGERKRF